ncbi:hypothetical protein J7E50_24695 [Pedobacter sp. ISL-68]|uniref:hypothetical protein n=1 Tax=unclassified Pedobacter TaxID=2628915 RepID=UPI001BEA017D|nr:MULTISPECIES: hypothetical protein [unclassified Pedobacter]MBT2563105.1 hypothetical protein [Pedobacter sp. ISL-64]MBT2593443.1 hypothetical protein [Pedobacter sp. ISL-68]
MKKITLIVLSLLLSVCAFAQTGVNTTTPNANAALDVVSTNKGLLPPRVALTATNAAAPLSANVAGMVVYNTATAGTAPNNVVPGLYYNNGAIWVPVTVVTPAITVSNTVAGNNLSTTVNGTTGTAVVIPNIYTADGTLAGNRTVTQVASTLAFTSTATNGFSVDGTTFSVDASNNRVGLGTAAPSTTLDVASASSPAFRLVDGTQGAGKVLSSDINGYASWVNNVAVTPTVLGVNPSSTIPYAAPNTAKYMGMSITLPAGKWIITVGLLINGLSTYGTGAAALVRHRFSTSGSSFTPISGTQLLQTGSFGFLLATIPYTNNMINFYMMNGSLCVNMASETTLYLWADNAGSLASAGATFTNLNVNNNGENYIYAIPIN